MSILTEAKEVLDPLCHTSPDEFRRIIKEQREIIEALKIALEACVNAFEIGEGELCDFEQEALDGARTILGHYDF